MVQAKLFILQTLWLLGIAATAQADPCAYPATALTNGNPVMGSNFTYSPVVKGTVKLEYMVQLTCPPYQTLNLDALALKGSFTVTTVKGSPAYVRITVIAADGSVPAASVVLYLNPPAPALLIKPNRPTGFTIQ